MVNSQCLTLPADLDIFAAAAPIQNAFHCKDWNFPLLQGPSWDAKLTRLYTLCSHPI
ncbi:hypothetical protein MtrunA17_Chr7g0274681 [Medicago truncatula]|uniref:Uncharacterized protein n=1 Tax=Medicago truncatula TaxID=3880 RepID=A0A396H9V9_MEDTR|nr:hypothetical protein MtrunA17_Chr7g0274681 [Medicago truncatula]